MTVHNHRPWQPMCNERVVEGQLRGACLNDDGSPRADQMTTPPPLLTPSREALGRALVRALAGVPDVNPWYVADALLASGTVRAADELAQDDVFVHEVAQRRSAQDFGDMSLAEVLTRREVAKAHLTALAAALAHTPGGEG